MKNKNGSDPLDNLSDQQIAELVQSNDDLDLELERIVKEDIEAGCRIKSNQKSGSNFLRRLRRSPLEIINRSLFFLFLSGFLFSFLSVYTLSRWLFYSYIISAFSCIFYTPNRKALKELLDAWPNLEDLIKKSFRKRY